MLPNPPDVNVIKDNTPIIAHQPHGLWINWSIRNEENARLPACWFDKKRNMRTHTRAIKQIRSAYVFVIHYWLYYDYFYFILEILRKRITVAVYFQKFITFILVTRTFPGRRNFTRSKTKEKFMKKSGNIFVYFFFFFFWITFMQFFLDT